MMSVNIQPVFDEQKSNFDHFNELKTPNFKHCSQDFKCLPGQKTGGSASIRINTVVIIWR